MDPISSGQQAPLGTTVVLLHGWPVTEDHWRFLIPALEAAGLDPLPLTLPGLGVPAEPGLELSKAALADWVLAQARERGVERFALVGHDWGGTVAALLAARSPQAVTALVVEEEILPGVDVQVPEPGASTYPDWHGAFNRAEGLAEALVPGREGAFYGAFLRQSAGPAGLHPEALAGYVAAYAAPGVLPAAAGHYRTRAQDLLDVAALPAGSIAAPTLAVGGRYGFGPAVGAGLRRLAPRLTELTLETPGHYPAEQDPEAFADAVVSIVCEANAPRW